MNIKVLGTKGCRNCEDLYEKISNLISEKKYDASIEKVTSIIEMSNYNVKEIPGLVIDDKLVLEGVVPSDEDIIKIIETRKAGDNITNEAKCCDGNCRF